MIVIVKDLFLDLVVVRLDKDQVFVHQFVMIIIKFLEKYVTMDLLQINALLIAVV